jgi:flagellar hook assembly protein FlgD
MAGATASNDGSMSGNHGGVEDVWLGNVGRCGDRSNDIANTTAVKTLSTNNIGKNLLTNYPNPFSNKTTISFSLPQTTKVSIKIFDMQGELIKILAEAQMQAGAHEILWNAKDKKGNAVNAGIYFLKLEAGNYSQTKKLVVVK